MKWALSNERFSSSHLKHRQVFLTPVSFLWLQTFRKIIWFHSQHIFYSESLLKPWWHCFENQQVTKVTKWLLIASPLTIRHVAGHSSSSISGGSFFWVFYCLMGFSSSVLHNEPFPHHDFFSSPLHILYALWASHSLPQFQLLLNLLHTLQWLPSRVTPTAYSTFLPGSIAP